MLQYSTSRDRPRSNLETTNKAAYGTQHSPSCYYFKASFYPCHSDLAATNWTERGRHRKFWFKSTITMLSMFKIITMYFHNFNNIIFTKKLNKGFPFQNVFNFIMKQAAYYLFVIHTFIYIYNRNTLSIMIIRWTTIFINQFKISFPVSISNLNFYTTSISYLDMFQFNFCGKPDKENFMRSQRKMKVWNTADSVWPHGHHGVN